MNSLVVACFLVFVAIATANPPVALLHTVDSIPNPNYGFHYAVNDPSTGDNKAQWETRDGDLVRGAYSLVEPDGNVRVVEYSADAHTGFNAIVKRTGPNIHSFGLPIEAHVAPIVTKTITPIVEAAPIVEEVPIAPIVHEPIVHEPIVHEPIVHEPIVHEPIVHEPIVHEPIIHEPLVAPILEPAPVITHFPVDYLHLPPLILPPAAPWVSVTGTTYGKKGNIVRRWTAGPISLDGQKVTIRTKHH